MNEAGALAGATNPSRVREVRVPLVRLMIGTTVASVGEAPSPCMRRPSDVAVRVEDEDEATIDALPTVATAVTAPAPRSTVTSIRPPSTDEAPSVLTMLSKRR